jgi:hypothetical protein
VPAGYDGIGRKAKKAWAMREGKERAGSRVGTGSGAKKAPETKQPQKVKAPKAGR